MMHQPHTQAPRGPAGGVAGPPSTQPTGPRTTLGKGTRNTRAGSCGAPRCWPSVCWPWARRWRPATGRWTPIPAARISCAHQFKPGIRPSRTWRSPCTSGVREVLWYCRMSSICAATPRQPRSETQYNTARADLGLEPTANAALALTAAAASNRRRGMVGHRGDSRHDRTERHSGVLPTRHTRPSAVRCGREEWTSALDHWSDTANRTSYLCDMTRPCGH